MEERRYPVPDAEAMARLLEKHPHDLSGLLLRLVWRAGLNREEIIALTWEQVDLDAPALRLPDREIPLEEETAEFLRRWKRRQERCGEYVALSRRNRRLSPPTISVMARRTLDEEGLKGIRFYDLRHDYVRRQFALRSWPEALRVTGISVSTYRNELAGVLGPGPEPPEAAGADTADEEYRLWLVLQSERDKPEGIALWLTNQMGLGLGEIAALTWDQVDFKENKLRLPDREEEMTLGVRRVLLEAAARRRPGEDSHVLLTPRARGPMDVARLATLTRGALIRGGITGRTAGDFRKNAVSEEEKRLLAYARENGSVSRAEAAEKLGLSRGQAYARLHRLEASGALVLLQNRYWPAEAVVLPEERGAAALRYIAAHGPVNGPELAPYLRIGKRRAAAVLRGLKESGDLELRRPEYRYYLTARGREKVTNL